MDRATIELHETAIRLAKGIVSARERWEKSNPSATLAVDPCQGPLTALLQMKTPKLKLAIGEWETRLATLKGTISAS
jgi:hypothetical protein